jgi:hypothetical protein
LPLSLWSVPLSPCPQETLKSQEVYKLTRPSLVPLPLRMPGAIHSRALWPVLGFAAASGRSGLHAWAPRARAPSVPPGWGTLTCQRSALDGREGPGTALWVRLIPKRLGSRGGPGALDGLALPCHGSGAAAHRDAVCWRQAKGVPPHCCPDATASAVGQGRCDPRPFCRGWVLQLIEPGGRPLPARGGPWGRRMKLLRLACGFSRGWGLHALRPAELTCLRPAAPCGTPPLWDLHAGGLTALPLAPLGRDASCRGGWHLGLGDGLLHHAGPAASPALGPLVCPRGAHRAPCGGVERPKGAGLVRSACTARPPWPQQATSGLAAGGGRRGLGLAVGGRVACGSHGGILAEGAAPAFGIAAVGPSAVVAEDGRRSSVATLAKHACLSGRIREGSGV